MKYDLSNFSKKGTQRYSQIIHGPVTFLEKNLMVTPINFVFLFKVCMCKKKKEIKVILR